MQKHGDRRECSMIGAMQVSMAGAQGTWRGGSDGAGEVWGQIMKDLER